MSLRGRASRQAPRSTRKDPSAMTAFWSRYGKTETVIALAGALLTALAGTVGHEWWWPVIVAVATAAGVHVAPASSGTVLPADKAGAGLS